MFAIKSVTAPGRAASLNTAQPAGRAFTPVVCKAGANTRRARIAERHRRLRNKLSGTAEQPRLAVFRSELHIYAQVIDDVAGKTLVAANTMQKDIKEANSGKGSDTAAAALVGKKIADLCKKASIERVCFDRGGFQYHGRVKAVADSAREAGLTF